MRYMLTLIARMLIAFIVACVTVAGVVVVAMLLGGCSASNPLPRPAEQQVEFTTPIIIRAFPETKDSLVLRFHGDIEFTDDERVMIEAACEALCQQTAGMYCPEIFAWDVDFRSPASVEHLGHRPALVRETSSAPWVDMLEWYRGGQFLGLTLDLEERLTVILFYDRLEDARWVKSVAMHELMHAAGLGHVPDGAALMSDHMCECSDGGPKNAEGKCSDGSLPFCAPITHMNDSDREEFCKVRGCEVGELTSRYAR